MLYYDITLPYHIHVLFNEIYIYSIILHLSVEYGNIILSMCLVIYIFVFWNTLKKKRSIDMNEHYTIFHSKNKHTLNTSSLLFFSYLFTLVK